MAQLGTFSYTSRLLNYVEPYYINGIAKTTFYTEVNTNILQNDKVFISNGYYDSETLYISRGKYVQNADGYTVLYANNCQIVIDLNYVGATQSYADDDFDDYLKIYHITSQREFDYINKLYVDTYPVRYSKFELSYTNNIIFADDAYFGDYAQDIGMNFGLESPGQFWARVGLNWVNVTNQFNLNSFTFSNDYYAAGLTSNGRIYVVGENFTYANQTYNQRNIYVFGTSSNINSWEIDIVYKTPIISKLYFKQGIFAGIHNDGIYGSYVGNQQSWSGTQSIWNSGFFVNSNWNFGLMNSKSSPNSPSYYATLQNGKPVQTTDFSNNKGFGYNYILDSNVYSSEIVNGNFINCNIGPTSAGFTAIDGYLGSNNNFKLLSLGGLYNYCNINNSEITNSTTLDSIIVNSYLNNTNMLNSQISESYLDGGDFSISSDIQVISSDIMGYVPSYMGGTTTNPLDIRGVLKLYISDDDYNRLDIFDNFYITQINKNYILSSLSTDQQILLPYETRYVIDTFFDFPVNGINQECVVYLRGKVENAYKVEVVYDEISTYSNTFKSNVNYYSSIDIDLGQYLGYFKNLSNKYTYLNQNIITTTNVQTLFLDTSITNSDIKDGVVEGITWINGSNVNYPSNIIGILNGQLNISKYSNNEINVTLNEVQPFINDNYLSIGSYIWLDSIYYMDNITGMISNMSSIQPGVISPSQGVYIITNVNQDPNNINPMVVTLYNPTLINPLSLDGYFFVKDSIPTYASINKLLIDSSTVESGLFERTLFTNTNFTNKNFNNLDTSLSINNTELLRIINVIFDNNANTINSGVVHKSHVLNVAWNSGILNNSIWIGPSFSNGVFNDGYWVSGIFNGFYFQNSDGVGLTSVDYSDDLHYNSWLSGTFNNGYFYNSSWLSGTFNSGKFYNSDWYAGTWNYGLLGDVNIPTSNTTMGVYQSIVGITGGTQTVWYDGTVNNAQVGGDGIVYWYDGDFNSGVFTSNDSISSVKESIWYFGTFNGGDFANLARWKNGTFSSGRFRSIYGWQNSGSTYSTDYSWEDGVFTGGEFGIDSFTGNSTWYDGEFDGGIFQGKVWNNGVFTNGIFYGSTTYSSISDTNLFSLSYTQSYYGLWRDGSVVDVKSKALPNQLTQPNNLRKGQKPIKNSVYFENVLWCNGIFDHSIGTIQNSIWLNGIFKNGIFTQGVFNPYIDRSLWDSNYSTPSFNTDLINCIWINGTFDGEFYFSDWQSGNFMSGLMSGAHWVNGNWNYGTAENVYWENGTWQNGIWDGSPFDYGVLGTNNVVKSGPEKDIILRVSNLLLSGTIHLINTFGATSTTNFIQILEDPTLTNGFAGWTYSNTGYGYSQWSYLNPGIGIQRQTISIPSISTLSYTTRAPYVYEFAIGSNFGAGDSFTIGILGSSVTYIAQSTDTPATIAMELVSLINQGTYKSIVKYQYYVGLQQVTYYGTWQVAFSKTVSSYNQGSVISSYQSFNTFTVTANLLNSYLSPIYVYMDGSTLPNPSNSTNYNQSESLYALNTSLNSTIFGPSESNYNISLSVGSSYGRTDFNIYIGSNVYTESLTNSTQTYNFSYHYMVGDPTSFIVKRINYLGPDNSSFTIISASVSQVDSYYHGDGYGTTYNNQLYNFPNSDTNGAPYNFGPTGSTVSLPSDLFPYTIAENSIVSLKFGNGVFKSGIWYGGFWNDGWRAPWGTNDDIYYFSKVNSYLNVYPNVWDVNLQSLGSSLTFSGYVSQFSDIQIGDKVSIGNLVFIDINENRNLVKDFYRVVYVSPTSITVEISTGLPVRRIEMDSDNHLIYVTKNIWLTGAFYNGLFRGIWNYGLFKGYPFITVMKDSHWINGLFDGGRFISTQNRYISQGNTYSYNTGLIQNFYFRDNNIAYQGEYLFDSWIDVNYLTYSMTNINQSKVTFDSTLQVNYSSGNLKGYPTVDVLSSQSIFRNSYDLKYQYYNLGYNYKIYNDFIGDGSYFSYPMSSTSIPPGTAEFFSYGWTYSSNDFSYSSNTSTDDDSSLLISVGTSDQTLIDNTYSDEIVKGRYSVIDFDLNFVSPLYQSNGLPSIYFLNSFTYNGFSNVINHGEFGFPGNKKEYFYNRNSLSMLLASPSAFTASFGKIQFYETDMIPFFQYTTIYNVDANIRNPIYGTGSFNTSFLNSMSFNNTLYPPPSTSGYTYIPNIPSTTSTTTTTTTAVASYYVNGSRLVDSAVTYTSGTIVVNSTSTLYLTANGGGCQNSSTTVTLVIGVSTYQVEAFSQQTILSSPIILSPGTYSYSLYGVIVNSCGNSGYF